MAGPSRDSDTSVAETAALITSRLDNKLGEVTESIQQLLAAEISELHGDAQLQELLHDTVVANVDTFFASIRHNIPVRNVEPPTAAMEYARRLAQREISANALVRAYRLGHRTALKAFIAEIRAANLERQLSMDVYELIEAVSFDYIDWISQQVIATYQAERTTGWRIEPACARCEFANCSPGPTSTWTQSPRRSAIRSDESTWRLSPGAASPAMVTNWR